MLRARLVSLLPCLLLVACGGGGSGGGSPRSDSAIDGAWTIGVGSLTTSGEVIDLALDGLVVTLRLVAETAREPVQAYEVTTSDLTVLPVDVGLLLGVASGTILGVGDAVLSGLYYLPAADVSVHLESNGRQVAGGNLEFDFTATCYDGYQILELEDPVSGMLYYEIDPQATQVSAAVGTLVLQG